MAEFCDRYSDSFHRWWDDLGQIDLNPSTVEMLVDGLASEAAKQTPEELSEQRDALIVAMLKATTPLRESN